jgi:hypothetical protein
MISHEDRGLLSLEQKIRRDYDYHFDKCVT